MTYITFPFNPLEQFKVIYPLLRLGHYSLSLLLNAKITLLWDSILAILKFSDKFCQHSIATIFLACCNTLLLLDTSQKNKLQHPHYTRQLEKDTKKRGSIKK